MIEYIFHRFQIYTYISEFKYIFTCSTSLKWSVKEHTAYQNTKYEYHFDTISYLIFYMYFVHVNVLGCMLIVNLEKHTFLETCGFI